MPPCLPSRPSHVSAAAFYRLAHPPTRCSSLARHYSPCSLSFTQQLHQDCVPASHDHEHCIASSYLGSSQSFAFVAANRPGTAAAATSSTHSQPARFGGPGRARLRPLHMWSVAAPIGFLSAATGPAVDLLITENDGATAVGVVPPPPHAVVLGLPSRTVL